MRNCLPVCISEGYKISWSGKNSGIWDSQVATMCYAFWSLVNAREEALKAFKVPAGMWGTTSHVHMHIPLYNEHCYATYILSCLLCARNLRKKIFAVTTNRKCFPS